METSTIKTTYVEPTEANVKATIEKIKLFASENNYQIKTPFPDPTNIIGSIFKKGLALRFESKSLQKVCRNHLTRVDKKIGLRTVNKFLHFLYKTIYKTDAAPHLDYSEKELKIKALKKSLNKARAEAEKLRLEYKKEKGDFYKKK